MSEISREQLEAFTEATIKSATELEKIVSALHIVVEKQDKIVDRIFNGMVEEIVIGVTNNYNHTHKETIDSLKRIEDCNAKNVEKIPAVINEIITNSDIAKDIQHVKWFVTIVGIVIIVATVILRGLDNRTALNNEIIEFRKAIAEISEIKQ